MRDPKTLLQGIRKQFPILDQTVNGNSLIYLDNAATTQKPQCVIDSVSDYYQQSNANVHRASHALSADATLLFESARSTVARYLNARSEKEIIWTRGTTEGINLVANSWGQQLKAGDEIILSTLEHHANIVPWQMLAQRNSVALKIIPLLDNGELDLEQFEKLLSNKTRLVAVTHASNALGTINPVKRIVELAHQAGALVLIDGAQALPHLQVDLQDLDADFYLFSGHKIFAPTGIGVLYGKEDLLSAMPPWQGGGEMIKHVSFDQTTYNDLPFKFEAGTPNISATIGLATALNWLSGFDRSLLEQHEQHLLKTAIDGCSQIKGFNRIGSASECVSLVSFTLIDQHQQDIGLLLDQQGIAVRTGHHCAMPLMQRLGLPGTTRASFAFYNTEAEVNHFIQTLDSITRPTAVAVESNSSPESLIDKLKGISGWNARYREIMLLGKSAKGLPQQLKTDEHLVKGCESNTWLVINKEPNDTLTFATDSDARIIRGLLVLVETAFNHKTADQICAFDLDGLFKQLELDRHLSPSRGNGLRAVIDKIYQFAQQAN
ncbi:SufS family cysteine desulfurase [Neptuniibacter sp. PT8_73]|uniref:SufS family cysteine desulfurase n=1 Tax=Neptuniibacter sp. PT8_73 TaxID=3398206 RepID=UPI0039F4D705